MRQIQRIIVMSLLLLGTNTGCGTLFNVKGHEIWLMGPPPERPIVPFGGVDNDLRLMSRAADPDHPSPPVIAAAAIDIPLSFVGDIVTLPWTAYQSLIVVRPNTENDTQPKKGNAPHR
jgi:hypothetical protein